MKTTKTTTTSKAQSDWREAFGDPSTRTEPASKFQVLFEDQTEGWRPTNLGIFTDPEEAREAGRNWLEGYATRRQAVVTRIALQELKPHPLPEGAVLI